MHKVSLADGQLLHASKDAHSKIEFAMTVLKRSIFSWRIQWRLLTVKECVETALKNAWRYRCLFSIHLAGVISNIGEEGPLTLLCGAPSVILVLPCETSWTIIKTSKGIEPEKLWLCKQKCVLGLLERHYEEVYRYTLESRKWSLYYTGLWIKKYLISFIFWMA